MDDDDDSFLYGDSKDVLEVAKPPVTTSGEKWLWYRTWQSQYNLLYFYLFQWNVFSYIIVIASATAVSYTSHTMHTISLGGIESRSNKHGQPRKVLLPTLKPRLRSPQMVPLHPSL